MKRVKGATGLYEQLEKDLLGNFGPLVMEPLMQAVQQGLTDEAPELSGAFKRSIVPYGASGPEVALDAVDSTKVHGDEDVTQALKGWQPGLPAGHATASPYSVRLASGASKQASQGWLFEAVRSAAWAAERRR